VLVALYAYSLHIDSRSGKVAVAEGLLSISKTAGVFSDHSRERVAGLVNMDPLNAGLTSIALQVVSEGVQGKLRARLACPIVPSPQGAVRI
jgi:hypothetical protein